MLISVDGENERDLDSDDDSLDDYESDESQSEAAELLSSKPASSKPLSSKPPSSKTVSTEQHSLSNKTSTGEPLHTADDIFCSPVALPQTLPHGPRALPQALPLGLVFTDAERGRESSVCGGECCTCVLLRLVLLENRATRQAGAAVMCLMGKY